MNSGKNITIIVAGGSGVRLGLETPKQYLKIKNKYILELTLEVFIAHKNIDFIQIVIAENHLELYQKATQKFSNNKKILPIVFGGITRQESVLNGLKAVETHKPKNILIHDAVRPFLSEELISKIISSLDENSNKACIPALQITDSVKEVKDNFIYKSLLRENLVNVQTPQGFDYNFIYNLHKIFAGKNLSDDSWLAELAQEKIALIEGEKSNYKITTMEDLERAKRELSEHRIGSGFDVHQFEEGDGVILCGVKIPYSQKLKGHSDADCAWHALTDAILGAIGEGDIGEHFPDTQAEWKNADSKIFLQYANNLLLKKGGKLINADITIICENPKLKNYKKLMKKSTAEALNLEEDRINIKATTTEKLGFLGRGEGLACEAVVSILI
ncbi:MAG: bifunctional 2-C-methyl-D-erythritol 4-phosphate cytidylyltransferase/2-C-methyl-D-erythritol 2,4-cyclodiphosphate synthase [Rickettsiales bacterium]|nr:bifunctional 2-C-methyl-D-erythritol 4-phosphate cytidylyltransferase/2-C-methyl-D-erythritol 2,4-cyclodiphosphate synthase [Rickettsiales bacterium]